MVNMTMIQSSHTCMYPKDAIAFQMIGISGYAIITFTNSIMHPMRF